MGKILQESEFVNALLNHHSLSELQSILGDDLYPITHMFAKQLPGDVERLGALLASNDMAAVRQLAHAIKGSSANLGAQELARLAGLIEQGAQRNAADEAHTAMAQLHEVAQQTLQTMQAGGFLQR